LAKSLISLVTVRVVMTTAQIEMN